MILESSSRMSKLSKTVSTVPVTCLESKLGFFEDLSDFVHKFRWKKTWNFFRQPIFSGICYIIRRRLLGWIHTCWTFKTSNFQWYPTPPSFVYSVVLGPRRIFKTEKNHVLLEIHLMYLSDHLSDVLKWKFGSSAF